MQPIAITPSLWFGDIDQVPSEYADEVVGLDLVGSATAHISAGKIIVVDDLSLAAEILRQQGLTFTQIFEKLQVARKAA